MMRFQVRGFLSVAAGGVGRGVVGACMGSSGVGLMDTEDIPKIKYVQEVQCKVFYHNYLSAILRS